MVIHKENDKQKQRNKQIKEKIFQHATYAWDAWDAMRYGKMKKYSGLVKLFYVIGEKCILDKFQFIYASFTYKLSYLSKGHISSFSNCFIYS